MIVAGVDEAGYGPLLGPLVVGCCAFEVPGPLDLDAPLPCVWTLLKRVVSRTRDRRGNKLHVNDSKVVYSAGSGLKELERSVLALVGAGRGAMTPGTTGKAAGEGAPGGCDDLHALLGRVAGHVLADLGGYPWYAPPADERFPLEQEAAAIRGFANALGVELRRAGAGCAHLAARVLPEGQLNDLFEKTRNKSNALFSISAIHLDFLLRTFGEQGLVIFCDRQGGREHYGSPLRQMFDEWAMEITAETPQRSEYRLTRHGHTSRLIFAEKAEAQCLPVAVASMLSKYLREALMRRFNAWWRAVLPGVEPTAGYYQDGTRFLRDIDAKRKELGIADRQLIRSR